MKLGLIGLDTSHVVRFAEVLNDPSHPYHIEGAQIVVGYPGGSSDLLASYSRVDQFTNQLQEEFNVEIVNSPEEVAEASDALLITSVDGRIHQQQFSAIASFQKPVFIDKPFTCSSQQAEEIYRTAAQYDIPLMSSSVLRYLEPLTTALQSDERIVGADCYCPLQLEPTNPGWFWYGIHGVEMLFTILGPQYQNAYIQQYHNVEMITGEWADGTIGTIRGSLSGNYVYGTTIHYAQHSTYIDSTMAKKPMFVSLLERVLQMFTDGQADVSAEETIAILRFIEDVNRGRMQ